MSLKFSNWDEFPTFVSEYLMRSSTEKGPVKRTSGSFFLPLMTKKTHNNSCQYKKGRLS